MSLLASLARGVRGAGRRGSDTSSGGVSRVPMGSGLMGGVLSLFSSGSDPEQQMEQFGRSGTLFGAVTLGATAVAAVRWHMFQVSDGRGRISGPDPRREITQHAALDMWNKPNPFMSGQFFREASMQHLLLTGLSYWVVSSVGTIPTFMWPVRPDRMTPVPDPKKFLSGWVYTGPGGEQVPLRVNEVVWVRQPSPLNAYTGMGAVEPLMADIEGASYISQWNRNFFRNSAQPGGYVSFPERLSDEQFEELSERWAEQHQGVQRAHQVAFLEMGATWTPAGYSMEDMQFIDLRRDSRDMIYEGFGTSKGLLGVVDDVNRANIQGSEYIFAKYRVRTQLERLRDAANSQFLPLFGDTAKGREFDFDDPVPADWEADAQTTKANATGAAALVSVGYDPQDVANAMSLPDLRHTGVIPSTVQPPLTQPDETYESAETESDSKKKPKKE